MGSHIICVIPHLVLDCSSGLRTTLSSYASSSAMSSGGGGLPEASAVEEEVSLPEEPNEDALLLRAPPSGRGEGDVEGSLRWPPLASRRMPHVVGGMKRAAA